MVASVILGPGATALAADTKTNKIYVVKPVAGQKGTLTVVDCETYATSVLQVGADPDAIAVDSVANEIFVANFNDNNVTIVDGATQALSTVATGQGPFALAVDPATQTTGVLNIGHFPNYGALTLISGPAHGALTVTPSNKLNALAVNTATNTFYTVGIVFSIPNLLAINGTTGVASSLAVGDQPGSAGTGIIPYAIAANPVTNTTYVLSQAGNGTVYVVDAASNLTASIILGNSPLGIAVNSITNKIYVLGGDQNGTVTVIDGGTNATSTFTSGYLPLALAVNEVANKIYVLNSSYDGSVTIVDGATNAHSVVILQSNPIAMAVNPLTNTIYVLNQDAAGTLTVIGGMGAVEAPSITAEPKSQTVAAGTPVVFNIAATGTPPLTYQWAFDGVTLTDGSGISGTSSATLFLSAGAAPDNAGVYTCAVTGASGSATSSAANLSVVNTANPGRLIDISTRASVGTGANQLIAGYVVGGKGTTGSEPLLIRASGPALAQIGLAGALADPLLTLNSSTGIIATDSGWSGNAQVASTATSVGAFAWTSPSSHDSALLESLPGGAYTAQVAGASGDTGVALAEVYDATLPGAFTPASPRLINISARVQVGTGANILIAGFVIGGTTSKTMLIRGSGPALAAFGLLGTLADPQLQLFQSNADGTSTLVRADTGWGGDTQIAAAAANVGAFSWGTPATPDSAILITLPPGSYTVQVSGESGDPGLALVEIYDVQ